MHEHIAAAYIRTYRARTAQRKVHVKCNSVSVDVGAFKVDVGPFKVDVGTFNLITVFDSVLPNEITDLWVYLKTRDLRQIHGQKNIMFLNCPDLDDHH